MDSSGSHDNFKLEKLGVDYNLVSLVEHSLGVPW